MSAIVWGKMRVVGSCACFALLVACVSPNEVIGTVEDSGAAGAGGASGATGMAGGSGSCPRGLSGPRMVEVSTLDGDPYCIDSTEVTNSQYARFLVELVPPQAVTADPPFCDFNETFGPTDGWPPAADRANHPVVYVDWCDAYAYCAWAGKRLCGRIGGGSEEWLEWRNPRQSQWYNACSAGGAKQWPYGFAFEATTCNGLARGLGDVLPVGDSAGCEGGFDGIFDIVGNAAEWRDNCETTNLGRDDNCLRTGGDFLTESQNSLDCTDGPWSFRKATGPATGFRCCSP